MPYSLTGHHWEDCLAALHTALLQALATPRFGPRLTAQVQGIGLGLGFAVLTAVPVGIAIGANRIARGILDPLIEFYRPTNKASSGPVNSSNSLAAVPWPARMCGWS